jgi:uncharacterized protein YndB with AHSA1/START domain
MTEAAKKASMRVSRIVKAERKAVYQAFLDPDTVASWLPSDTMTSQVQVFDAHEGSTFRITLTYRDVEYSPRGKTRADTGTFQGKFVGLVPYRLWKRFGSSRRTRPLRVR